MSNGIHTHTYICMYIYDNFCFPVFEVLDNDTIVELSREIQNGKVIMCDDIDEMENKVPTSKLCKLPITLITKKFYLSHLKTYYFRS